MFLANKVLFNTGRKLRDENPSEAKVNSCFPEISNDSN